jgi:hypothetical protein
MTVIKIKKHVYGVHEVVSDEQTAIHNFKNMRLYLCVSSGGVIRPPSDHVLVLQVFQFQFQFQFQQTAI